MNEIITTPQGGMSIEDVLQQKRRIAELMSSVLKKGEHYGIIPGTQKPTLYKSGAEIIALTFGIHAEFKIEKTILENGHREYEVICSIFRNSDKMAVGMGVGTCSSTESKYRWRNVKKFNPETKKQEESRIENPNIEDLFNTILKMAKKRAFVDAVITATAASDFVSQDLEDFAQEETPEIWEMEIETISDIETLKKYYNENKGKGPKFGKAIMAKKAQLEILNSNQKTNENIPNGAGNAGVDSDKKGEANGKFGASNSL